MSEAFEITGADTQTIAIAPGEFYFNTKARCRRMMRNSLSSEARQIHACLELGTMGFQQELAVMMENGKERPMTPGDISRRTGLKKQNVPRGLAELADAGLAETRSDDGGALRKGHILIYSWAVPREPKIQNGNRARLPFPDWFPASWEPLKPLIKRLKLDFSMDEVTARDYFEEGGRAARDYQKAEKVIIEFLKRVCAQPKKPRINKEERTERKNERKGSPPTPSHVATREGTQTPPVKKKTQKPEDQDELLLGLLFAAEQAWLRHAEGELPEIRRYWQSLTTEERKAAIEGIRLRVETGEYADAHYNPTLLNYLRKKLWTAKLRPPAQGRNGKKRVNTSGLDAWVAGTGE